MKIAKMRFAILRIFETSSTELASGGDHGFTQLVFVFMAYIMIRYWLDIDPTAFCSLI